MQTWWRENRPDSPALFDDEMADAIDRICKNPGIGTVYPAKSGPPVRRVLMKTTQNRRMCLCPAAGAADPLAPERKAINPKE